MNEYIKAAIKGCVQGLSEFLPISSSGHLLLLSNLGLGEESLFFDLLLHVSTLLVVILVFRKNLFAIIKNPLGNKAKFIIIASIPTAVMAGLIRYFLYDYSLQMLPFCFMLTTVLLFSTKYAQSLNLAKKWKHGDTKVAIITGFVQGIACLAGVSRSGSTISAMKHMGMENEDSGELTFLLSIPIIIGSAAVELICYNGAETLMVGEALIGMVFAFISGLLAVKTFIKLLNKGKIWIFSIYTFLISIFSFYVVYF